MHYWGDEWFEKNGNDLYQAIDFIEKNLRKHQIGVCGKEKYGTYRDQFLNFWSGGLYDLLFGHRCYIGTFHKYPKWVETIIDSIHRFIYYKLDYYVICPINQKLGLIKLIHDHQAKMYNKTFQLACKKWPNVITELIVDIDGYEMIKPCKWGNIDGTSIHNKYWRQC